MFSKTGKIIKIFIYTISFLLFISGCQRNPPAPTSVAEIQNTATVPVTATATATEIPPSLAPVATHTPTATPTSTATPTNTPTSTPTPIPPVIEVENVGNLTRSSWGDGSYSQIAWSPDSQQLLLATSDEMQWLDSQTFDVLNVNSIGTRLGSDLTFDNARSIIANGYYGTIEIWDLEAASLRFSLEGHNGYITNKVFSPDGQVLASSGADGTVRLWDMNTGELQYEFTDIALPSEFEDPNEFTELVRPRIDISPDGKSLVIGVNITTYLPEINSNHNSSNIQIFDLQTGIFQRILEEYRNGFISDVTYSPDGHIIGVVHEVIRSEVAEFRDSTTGDLIDGVSGLGLIHDMAFAPNMSVVGLSHSGGITLRDIHNKETVGLLEIPSGAYNTIQFSPDSTKIVARSSEWVRIWDVETQDVLQTKQLDSFFLSMGLNSVSHIVATISYGSPEIQLHDLQT
jgi:WD40 repeat protein